MNRIFKRKLVFVKVCSVSDLQTWKKSKKKDVRMSLSWVRVSQARVSQVCVSQVLVLQVQSSPVQSSKYSMPNR